MVIKTISVSCVDNLRLCLFIDKLSGQSYQSYCIFVLCNLLMQFLFKQRLDIIFVTYSSRLCKHLFFLVYVYFKNEGVI